MVGSAARVARIECNGIREYPDDFTRISLRCIRARLLQVYRLSRASTKMTPSISFKKIWEDDDMVELTISINDGRSLFQCDAYVGHKTMADTVEDLTVFKDHIYGGLYDLRFGEFGPEYASGAFHARFEFHRSGNGKLSITARAESDWNDFTHTKVASNATLYLRTEPALFDNWLKALSALKEGLIDDAMLECIQ